MAVICQAIRGFLSCKIFSISFRGKNVLFLLFPIAFPVSRFLKNLRNAFLECWSCRRLFFVNRASGRTQWLGGISDCTVIRTRIDFRLFLRFDFAPIRAEVIQPYARMEPNMKRERERISNNIEKECEFLNLSPSLQPKRADYALLFDHQKYTTAD